MEEARIVQTVWDTIGVSEGQKKIDAVKRGLPTRQLSTFIEETQLPRAAVLRILKIKRADLDQKQKLSGEESERFWRLAKIYRKAITLCDGDRVKAARWLTTPQIAFGKNTPLAHITTEPGAAEVLDLIGRLEYGVAS